MKGLPLVCMLLVGASLFGTTASAMAQPRIGACAADIRKHCADIQPGEGRISACVKEHFNDLSDACKVRLARIAAVAKACIPDVKEHCASAGRGRGRIATCLKGILTDLSDTCKAALVDFVAGKK